MRCMSREPASPVLYDWIGSDYDATRRADPYLADRLRSHLNPHPDGTYLDIACGTGNYTLALAQRDVRLIGIDQSATMILAAAAKAGPVRWCIGDVRWLPLPDATFHGAICTLAIHHFADLARSFREVHRVLAPGARWVLFTSTHQQMRGCWLNEYFPASIARSIQQMPDLPVVRSHLQAAGFSIAATEPYDVQPDLQDFFMYSGKHRPAHVPEPQGPCRHLHLCLLALSRGDRRRLPSSRRRHPHRPHPAGHRLLPPPRRRLPVPDRPEGLIRRRFPTSIPRPGNPRHLPLMPSPQHQQAAKHRSAP